MNRTAEFRSPWPRSALGPTATPSGTGFTGPGGACGCLGFGPRWGPDRPDHKSFNDVSQR